MYVCMYVCMYFTIVKEAGQSMITRLSDKLDKFACIMTGPVRDWVPMHYSYCVAMRDNHVETPPTSPAVNLIIPLLR